MLMQPQDQAPYNFILDPSSHRSRLPFLQTPKQKRIVMVLFIAVILIFVLIVGNLLLSSGKQSNQDLVTVASYQTEIVRISKLGLKTAKDSNTRNRVSTLEAFVASDLSNSKDYLAKFGPKLTSKRAILKRDKTIDSALTTASETNTFDRTLITQLDSLQEKYKSSLQKALQASPTNNKKILLNKATTDILIFEGAK